MPDTSITVDPQVVWLNGQFLPLHQAAVSPLDRGFLYGDGLFETIRAEAGHPLFVQDHRQRLERSLTALRIPLPFTPDWPAILCDLLQRNQLAEQIASLKIIVSRGTCPGLGLPSPANATLCATAQRYTPPPAANYQRGWRLHIFREGFAPPLARYKSLNYLYFLSARQTALDAGADEAVVLDAAGKVCETSAGSLLVRSQGIWWTPANVHQLPSITLQQVRNLLVEAGVAVAEREATAEDLGCAETIWVLNSLIGIMPVRAVEEQTITDRRAEEASRLRSTLFARGRFL